MSYAFGQRSNPSWDALRTQSLQGGPQGDRFQIAGRRLRLDGITLGVVDTQTLYIDPAGYGDYTTLQAALDALPSLVGPSATSWAIVLRNGTYVEPLIFKTAATGYTLTIIGWGEVIIHPSGSWAWDTNGGQPSTVTFRNIQLGAVSNTYHLFFSGINGQTVVFDNCPIAVPTGIYRLLGGNATLVFQHCTLSGEDTLSFQGSVLVTAIDCFLSGSGNVVYTQGGQTFDLYGCVIANTGAGYDLANNGASNSLNVGRCIYNTANTFGTITPKDGDVPIVPPASIGPGSAQYQYLVTGATPFTPAWSAGFLNIASGKTLTVQNTLTLSGTDGGALSLAVPNTKTLTLTVADSYDLTVPATGTAELYDWHDAFTPDYNREMSARAANLDIDPTNQGLVIAFIGDSWVWNKFIDDPLRRSLQIAYGDGGAGYVGIGNNNGAPIVEGLSYARAGTWTDVAPTGSPRSVDASESTSSDTSTPASVTIVANSASFTIHYLKQSGGGSFRYNIDAGSWTTVSTSNASDLFATEAITGLTLGAHTLKIEITVAGAAGVTLFGVDVRTGLPGAVVHRLGGNGASTGNFVLIDATLWEAGLTALAPDVVMILLGLNDVGQGISPATSYSNLSTMIDRAKAAMPLCDVVLLTQVASSDPVNYNAQVRVLAYSKPCILFDVNKDFGPYADNNSRGLYGDVSHLNNKGGQVYANKVYAKLVPERNPFITRFLNLRNNRQLYTVADSSYLLSMAYRNNATNGGYASGVAFGITKGTGAVNDSQFEWFVDVLKPPFGDNSNFNPSGSARFLRMNGSGEFGLQSAPLVGDTLSVGRTAFGYHLALVGYAQDGSTDTNGVAFALGHNASGNRQLAIVDNVTNIGVRFITSASYIGGYNAGAAATLNIMSACYVNTDGNVTVGTVTDGMTAGGSLAIAKDLAHRGTLAGFFNTSPAAQQTGNIVAGLNNLGLFSGASLKLSGIHASTPITYISGTGTAGTDNTAMTIKTVTLPANSLTQVGDRMRIRSYFAATAGAPAVGTTELNGVTTANTSVSGTNLALTECWIHYIDNTHANIIENENGALGNVSAPNVSGFSWNSNQDIIFTQDAVVSQHLVLYALIIDVFPKGV